MERIAEAQKRRPFYLGERDACGLLLSLAVCALHHGAGLLAWGLRYGAVHRAGLRRLDFV